MSLGLHPNHQRTLNDFRLSSDAEIVVNKHRLSAQIGAKCAEACLQCVPYIPTELPFCTPLLVVGIAAEAKSMWQPCLSPSFLTLYFFLEGWKRGGSLIVGFWPYFPIFLQPFFSSPPVFQPSGCRVRGRGGIRKWKLSLGCLSWPLLPADA